MHYLTILCIPSDYPCSAGGYKNLLFTFLEFLQVHKTALAQQSNSVGNVMKQTRNNPKNAAFPEVAKSVPFCFRIEVAIWFEP